MKKFKDEQKFKQFLDLHWLRPEKALLAVFKSKAFNNFKFQSPSLDISCGDGVFMFIHLGGVFEESFDYFQSTKADQFKHGSGIDIFDSFDKNYKTPIVRRADVSIDFGIDWKQNLLDRAAKLNLYKNLIHHDNNNLPLPFEDNFFKTIYSNSIYWVEDVGGLLDEVRRILHPRGIAVLEVMTSFWLETLDEMEKFLSPEAIAILDRNRRKTMPGSRAFKDWKKLIANRGFDIVKVTNVYPNKILTDIWNVGLRPVSHLLIRMTESLSAKQRLSIKKEWVDIVYKLAKPLLALPNTYTLEKAPYLSFEVKKSK